MVIARRHILFFCLILLIIIAWSKPLYLLVSVTPQDSHYTHIPLVPLISIALAYRQRKLIFGTVALSPRAALPFVGLGLTCAVLWANFAGRLSANDSASIMMLSLMLLVVGCFTFVYGPNALHKASFSALLLLMSIPLPDLLMRNLLLFLQHASATTADAVFRLLSIPFYRSDVVIYLPGKDIEIASACSGIRATLFLILLSVVAAHLYLRVIWTKLALVSVALPLSVIRNGLRIVALSLLDTYVDPATFSGKFHEFGGIPFFLVSLALLTASVRLLAWAESRMGITQIGLRSTPTEGRGLQA